MCGGHRQVGGSQHRRTVRIGICENEACQAPRQRSLADPLGSADQPGMRQPARPIGLQHGGLGRRLPDQRRRLARMTLPVEAVALLGVAHAVGSRPARKAGSRCVAAAQIVCATTSEVRLASMTTQRAGSAAARSRKASRSCR